MRTKKDRIDILRSSGLYLVTSTSLSRKSTVETVKDFLDAGGRLFQLREKDWDRKRFLSDGKVLRELADHHGALFILNDDPELALELNSDGVHLGQEDMSVSEARSIIGEDAVIGVSTHNIEEALKAVSDGADYINIGPVFPTDTKKGFKNISLQEVERIVSSIDIPFTFMGGIKLNNLGRLIKFGPSALAMITELTMSEDVKSTTMDIIKVIGK